VAASYTPEIFLLKEKKTIRKLKQLF